jgi:DNA ligase D
VRRRYGIEPDQVPDFIALRGDPSDGLPGARGVGEKTARDLLRVHGSLEGAIAGTRGDTSRVAAALADDPDQLRAFAEIARLRRVDLARPADRPTDFAGAAAAARARGMNRLADRLDAATSTPQTDRPRAAPDRLETYPVRVAAPPEPAGVGEGTPEGDPDREVMPEGIVPMLARTGAVATDDERWAYEFKWDGVRAIAYSQPGRLRLESRNLNDITGHYPELAGLYDALGSHRVVLDGEIVCFDADGQPSFAALQHRMHIASEARARQLAQTSPVTYVIFDVLWLDGHSLMGQPYGQRRERLAELGLTGERWRVPDHVVGQGVALRAASAAQELEGIIAKRLDSRYEPGQRSGAWVKIKNVGRQEFVIGGWLPGEGRRKERIGALLVGVYEAGGLRCAGRVGTGFSEAELDRLARLMAPLEHEASPFSGGPAPPRGAVFCLPQLVCEVEFTEWTQDGQLRHPSYKGLRDDKPAAHVVREDKPAAPLAGEDTPAPVVGDDKPPAQLASEAERAGRDRPAGLVVRQETAKSARTEVEGRELVLSNLAKVLYPAVGFTKRAVIDYYAAVAPVLLPHLEGRALTVKRYPDGVDGKAFYEKQAPAHRPDWMQTVPVASERREWMDYTLAQDLATLVWLANLAALELHTPLGRAAAGERPTTLVFDLDPGLPATIVECCRVGLLLQGMFEALGLQSYPKTSGSKGLQVYVPLNSDVTFAQTKPFARQVAELFERASRTSSSPARPSRCVPARCSSTGAKTTNTRRPCVSTRCGPGSGRPSPRRWIGPRSAPRSTRATPTTSPSMPPRSSTGCRAGGTSSPPCSRSSRPCPRGPAPRKGPGSEQVGGA